MSRPSSTLDGLADQIKIADGLARLFEIAMQDGRTSPLSALETLATALGVIYRDAAVAHTGPGACSCGWVPDRDADHRALAQALRKPSTSAPATQRDIRLLKPAGTA